MSSTTIDEPVVKPMPETEDDLATLAAHLVATWPRLSTERKAELGRLLSSAA